MEAGALRSMVGLLKSGSPDGRDSAAWALAELAAVDVFGTRMAMRREKVQASSFQAEDFYCIGLHYNVLF